MSRWKEPEISHYRSVEGWEVARGLLRDRNEALGLLEDIKSILKFKDLRVDALLDRLRVKEPTTCPECGGDLQEGINFVGHLASKPSPPHCSTCGRIRSQKTVRERVDDLYGCSINTVAFNPDLERTLRFLADAIDEMRSDALYNA